MEPIVRRYTGRDGVQLAYRELGEGRPLILLPGFGATSRSMIDHGPGRALAELGHRVIATDPRGNGDSARDLAPAAYPPDVLVDDGLALVEHLGLDDYDLSGYSLGARVALRMMVRGARPARAVLAGQDLNDVTRPYDPNNRHRRMMATLAADHPLDADRPNTVQTTRWLAEADIDPRALVHVFDSLVPTTHQELTRVEPPTLIVIGVDDERRPGGPDLAQALPHGRFAEIPGDHEHAIAAPRTRGADPCVPQPGPSRTADHPSRPSQHRRAQRRLRTVCPAGSRVGCADQQ
jgi:pimeloyl-ACP methyl ester carboxylesterase